jgi:hypothetical protein
MSRILILFILFAGIFMNHKIYAQKSPGSIEKTYYCTDYHKKSCTFKNKDLEFQYNSQSRSALFRPGQSSSFTFTSFKGYDYRLTFCGEDLITKGSPIAFKLMDAKTKEVLFDSENAEENSTEFEFTCDNTLNLRVEVSMPEADAADKAKYGCVGFLLQSRKNLNTGF